MILLAVVDIPQIIILLEACKVCAPAFARRKRDLIVETRVTVDAQDELVARFFCQRTFRAEIAVQQGCLAGCSAVAFDSERNRRVDHRRSFKADVFFRVLRD